MTFTIPLEGETFEGLRGRHMRVTLVDGERAVEAMSGPAAGGNSPPIAASDQPLAGSALLAILGVALLGGFVLNLMPCVFPVLSLKLLAFVTEDDGQVRAVRARFAASAAGIVASFLLLASAMALLKGYGATVGWGIQFQQPVFLAAMVAMLTLFAANLLGLFEIVLSSRLAGGLDRVGRGDSLAAHFASGCVVTLLATPCSAPFVGTAVGFALSRGPGEIYLVFAALGLGMAAPYLLVAAVPRIATMLPRPGRWMLTVKRVMALGLLATAAWLTTIVASIAGTATALALIAVLAVVIAASRWWWAGSGDARPVGTLVSVGALVLILVAAVVGAGGGTRTQQTVTWRAFDEGELRALVREGRTVLVDVTADWCITCKVNKAIVLQDADVERRLDTNVIPIRGDWTKPDARIAAYLQTFGRYGLPFNVVYGPAAPEGIVLPELLSERAVLEAFDRASAGTPATISLNQ